MWSVERDLSNLITNVLIHKKFDLFPVLEDELNRRYKNYDELLKDTAPSKVERDKVKRSVDEPIQLNYLKTQKKLSPSLVEEALTLSDLFNLNECSSVELLTEAEEQMQYFHGFNRGLTAVLLYYDSKKIIVNNLKTLIMARTGRTWVLDENIPHEITNFIDNYVNKLLQNGMVAKILNQIGLYDWPKAEENLSRVNGLGNLKHRKQVKNLFEEIKTTLAECLFDCSCQIPFTLADTILLINFLKTNCTQVNSSPQTLTNNPETNKMSIETSYLYLIMSLLYSFECGYLENKDKLEIEKITKNHLKDDYMKNIYKELTKSDSTEWVNVGVKSILQFSFQVFINMLNSYLIENELTDTLSGIANSINGLEDDETLIENAIQLHVFGHLKNLIIQHDRFHQEKYFVERVHNLITDFIYKMPDKIKDMKNRNEELIRISEDTSYLNQSSAANLNSFYHHASFTGGYANQPYIKPATVAPNENHDFEDFLNLIGDLYIKDPLKLELSINFWIADSELNQNVINNYQKPSQKQVSLYKFVRYILSGDSLVGCLYIAYINMLTGLCTGEESAQHCFLLLQNNGHFYDSYAPKISWNHIFFAFERYHDIFRIDNQNQLVQQNMNYNFQNQNQMRSFNKGAITQQELQGLISVTKLVRHIAFYNEKARIALCEYQRGTTTTGNDMTSSFNTSLASNDNNLPTLMFGLLTCSIPVSLKGEILNLLAALSLNPLISINMWQLLENSQILPTMNQMQQSTAFNSGVGTGASFVAYFRNDIKIELEEVESREETYPLLKGFLNLIKTLVSNSNVPENLGYGLRPKSIALGFQPYLQFLVNNVYLKVLYRSYKNPQEKWQITAEILAIFYEIISKYEINTQDFQNTLSQSSSDSMLASQSVVNPYKSPVSNSPGYKLIYDLIHDGPIVRMLFIIINECINHLLEYNSKNDPFIEKTSLTCLKLFSTVIEKQKQFIEQMKQANLSIENTGLEKLIISLNPKTNRADYLMSILRFIQFNSSLIAHSYYSLNIVYMLSNYSIINSQMLNLFLKSCLSLNEQFELMHSFVEFLEFDESNELSKEANMFEIFKTNIDSNELNENASIIQQPNQPTENSSSSNSIESNYNEIRSACRLQALKLLMYYLKLQSPNLSHLLLGFDINKSLKNQAFFNPGTKISYGNQSSNAANSAGGRSNEVEFLSIVPRNCLHSIIRIINKFLKDPTKLLDIMPNTIELCYEILFMLCSNFNFNQQLLNYLRNEFDFVNTNLKKIPIIANVESKARRLRELEMNDDMTLSFMANKKLKPINDMDSENFMDAAKQTQSTSHYSIYSWILNLICIEIQILISNRMKTALKKLVQLLVETNASSIKSTEQQQQNQVSKIFSQSNFDSLIYSNYRASKTMGLLDNLETTNPNDTATKSENSIDTNNKLFVLLSIVNFSQPTPEPLTLNYFDSQLIEKVIDTCKYSTEQTSSLAISGLKNANIQLYDIKKLKNILVYEIKQSGLNISRVNLTNELNYILENVYLRNIFQLNYLFKKKYFESLKLLLETFVLLTPCDAFNLNQRFTFLNALIRRLFLTLNGDDIVVELTFPISNLLFTLVTNLRQVIYQLKKQNSICETNISSLIQQQTSFSLNLSNLSDIFKKIIDYLLNSSLTNFKVRTHLYATILNYLMIFDKEIDLDSSNPNVTNAGKKINSINAEILENFRILSSNMNGLLKIICSDSCEGLNITTMMGLSVLNRIIDMDSSNYKWIKYLSDNGYIKCIINTILNTDNQLLEECFHTQAKNDKVIYIFESKIALFLTMSNTTFGSDNLLKSGLINCISACSVFNLRVRFDRNIYGLRNSNYLIQLLNQFYQIFFPILNLFISIINTMGANNVETKSQISKFVLSHGETFLHILSSKANNLKMLEELKLVTSLLCKLAPFDNLRSDGASSSFSVEHNSVFSRIHKEMLNLICIFFVPDQLKQLKKEIEHNSAMTKENISKYFSAYVAEIASNICSYCASIMKVGGQQSFPLLIFVPKIENTQLHPYSPNLMKLNSNQLQLGLLIDFLKYTIDNLEKTIEQHHDLNIKNERINDLIEIEKKQLVGEFKLFEKMTENEKQLYLKDQLKLHLKSIKQNKYNYIAIIEKVLLILWRHIEFYLSNFDSINESYQLFRSDFYNVDQMENLKRYDNKIKNGDSNREELLKFRQDLIFNLNPTFFKRCSEIEQKIDNSRRDNFIGILVKRTQRLIHLNDTTA